MRGRQDGQRQLLLSAARLADLQPEVADVRAGVLLQGLLAHLAHAMVDLAVGAARPDGAPVRLAGGDEVASTAAAAAEEHLPAAAVRVSCSAAAAEIQLAGACVRGVQHSRGVPGDGLAESLERLRRLLQAHAQEPDPAAPAARQRLLRGLGGLLGPADPARLSGARSGAVGGDGPATVHP